MIFYRVSFHHGDDQEGQEFFYSSRDQALKHGRRLWRSDDWTTAYQDPRVERMETWGDVSLKRSVLLALNGAFRNRETIWEAGRRR